MSSHGSEGLGTEGLGTGGLSTGRLDTETTGSAIIDRLAEGPAVWGSFSAGAGRYGVCRYRLVVFPPGISSMQRRRLRLWRGWPVWGLVMWLAVAVGLSSLGASGTTVLVVATAVLVVSGVVARRTAGTLPSAVRTVDLTTIPGYNVPEGMPTPKSIADTLAELRSADRRLERGAIILLSTSSSGSASTTPSRRDAVDSREWHADDPGDP